MPHRVLDALRRRFCAIFMPATCLLVCLSAASGEEPVQQFLDALRQRGYLDTALEYIAEQEQNLRLSEELRQSLGFERAMTLLEMSRKARTSNSKTKALADAQAALEKFAREFPRHTLAARANAELGNILFERARAAVWQSEAPPPNKTKGELRQEARDLIAQARGIYQKAFDLYNTQLQAFPAYIDEDDKDMRERFRIVQGAVITNQLNLARCTYEEGQTWDKDSEQRRKLLLEASELFRKTHEPYRTWMGGLTARLWQAKCFEELGDVGTALGIYHEVLGHSDADPAVRDLKALALRFRLICLNHPNKKDFKLAILQSDQFLSAQGRRTKTENAIGIRWQKARAHDLLGQSLQPADAERERQLRLAMAEAEEVSRYATPYKDVANAMVRRLKAELGDREGPPKDFDTAFELARSFIKRIQALKTAAAQAGSGADRQKAREDLKLELQKTDDMLTLALQLADDEKNGTQMLQAQYLLSFVKYERRRPYEAIVLARHVMNRGGDDDPETAMNAAEVAMVACVQAFNDAGKNYEDEISVLEEISSEIINQWPESDRANEARMSLGMINHKADRTGEAARWYTSVPKTAKQYGEAQLAAGQTWWQASLSAGQEKASPVDPQQIKQMTDSAEKHLREGLRVSVNPGATPAASVTAARLSLAQILNGRGAFAESIKLLTEGDQSVIRQVQVPDPAQRPERGVKGKDFASLAYQVLLRAYVGTQRIDEALTAMSEMEKIGGPDTQIYVQLGRELEREIERLKTQNDSERLQQLRSSFEQFLSKVFERKDRQNYNSLIWVAETYRGLGQGMSDDPATAANYFKRAADSYNQILQKDLVDAKRRTTVELRLVNCRRMMRDFDGAMAMLDAILKLHPRDMNAQFEGAYLLADWGRQADPSKLNDAIAGIPADAKKKTIWGWIALGQRLQSPSYQDKYFESQYAMVECRRDYALLGEPAKKKAGLEAAVRDVELIVATQGAFGDPWWSRFDAIYRDLQKELGNPNPKPLQKVEEFAATPVVEEKPVVAQAPEQEPPTREVQDEPGGNSMLAIAGAFIIALAAAGGMWFYMSKPRRTGGAVSQLASAPAPSFEGINVASTQRKKKPRAATGQSAARRPAGSGATARKPSSGGQKSPSGGQKPRQGGTRKPRPKPPENT